MKGLKFRYVVKNKHTGVIYFRYYTLNQIEISGLGGLFDIENYEIISRDRLTGSQDKNGSDIYEGDKIPLKMTFDVDDFKDCSYTEKDEHGVRTYKKVDTVNCVVCYEDGEFVFRYKDHVKSFWIAKINKNKWKVTGSIHENN